MSDDIRQTPIPVPFVYGQPATAPSTDNMSNPNEPLATVAEDPSSGMAAAPAPSTEAAASPSNPASGSAPQNTTTAAATTTTTGGGTPTPTSAPSPAAAPGGRTGTPLRSTNGGGQENAPPSSTSRAASQHPDPGFSMPAEAPAHGAPARQYLNAKVTGPLLDGMKKLVQEKPKDPLRVLGEYLIQRSKELETGST